MCGLMDRFALHSLALAVGLETADDGDPHFVSLG